MSKAGIETVLHVHHWTETLFSFRTTRDPSLRFENGQFVMIGLETETGKRIMRAYSIASPNYEDHMEFYSIKVPDGPLTSRLQHLQPGDSLLVSTKPTGTLVISDLSPGRRLYLFATGTGLAPYLSIIQDPETYERFEHVVLVHGVRQVAELAYAEFITVTLPEHPYLGDEIREKLIYVPTVTREPFRCQGRIPTLVDNGQLSAITGLPALDPASDRAMICGSPSMLESVRSMLDVRGFGISPRIGVAGDYVIERAFVEK